MMKRYIVDGRGKMSMSHMAITRFSLSLTYCIYVDNLPYRTAVGVAQSSGTQIHIDGWGPSPLPNN